MTFRVILIVVPLGVVSSQFSAGQHLEGLRTQPQLLVHALVVGAGQVRDADFKKRINRPIGGSLFSERLAADPVGSAGPLLQDGGIPSKVEMHDVATVPMQVDSLLSYRRANQHLGQ